MVNAERLRCFMATLIFPGLLFNAFGADAENPTTLAVGEQKEESTDFKFLQTPVTEEGVSYFVNHVRSQLKQLNAPGSVPKRDAYVRELVGVLEQFVLKDALRENLTTADKRRLWLSDRTAARVVRLLGDLNAIEAVQTISEHLLIPEDVEYPSLPHHEDSPARWALFQIGDASLPVLRNKMTSESQNIPRAAARTAAYILGPRAEEQLSKWTNEAKTPEERERLAKHSLSFVGTTKIAEHNYLLTPEEYRRVMLEEGRRRLDNLLGRPTEFELKEMKRKLKQVEAKGAGDE